MILPGDTLWARFRVARVETERVDCAWLRALAASDVDGGAATHVLLSLQPPAASALAELLAALWPGPNPPAAWLKEMGADAASVSPSELHARLPLLGDVEWRGAPEPGGVALLELKSGTPLRQFHHVKARALDSRGACGLLADFAAQIERLLQSTAHRGGRARFCAAMLKLLNPHSVAFSADGSKLIFIPQIELRSPTLEPPDWAFYAAPEAVTGGACGEAALAFGLAQLALALLFDPAAPDAKTSLLLPRGWLRLAVADIALKEFKHDPRAAALPAELRALLAKCLKPRAAGRFATLAKFSAALRKSMGAAGETVLGAPLPALSPAASGISAFPLAPLAPATPDGMTVIAAGAYLSGEKKSPRTLRAYAIDVLPVTEKNFRDFLKETGREPVPDGPGSRVPKYDRHPVVNVTWREAEEYAAHYGKRLPTIYEWEKAARGKDGRKFPYGNEYVAQTGRLRASAPNSAPGKEGPKETAPVGTFPQGASPYGVLDMAGNVLEWTSTARRQGERIFRAAKGACFLDGSVELSRCASMQFKKPDARESHLGFRCVKDVD
ncbi:MAG TPA: SUMF1/EgtB/PvdO family nonheme iron enzyme [Planctomycetota bacterium]|nr:SUMF1/EgtB/PvdO family nonheme iron enzyme [Planctomycetota bacterium]